MGFVEFKSVWLKSYQKFPYNNCRVREQCSDLCLVRVLACW